MGLRGHRSRFSRSVSTFFSPGKLAWYAELLRIYHEEPELLLPGEKEMIESWGDK